MQRFECWIYQTFRQSVWGETWVWCWHMKYYPSVLLLLLFLLLLLLLFDQGLSPLILTPAHLNTREDSLCIIYAELRRRNSKPYHSGRSIYVCYCWKTVCYCFWQLKLFEYLIFIALGDGCLMWTRWTISLALFSWHDALIQLRSKKRKTWKSKVVSKRKTFFSWNQKGGTDRIILCD